MEILRLRDVCTRTGLSKPTIIRLIRAGQGPRYRRSPTGLFLFDAADIDQWISKWEHGEMGAAVAASSDTTSEG